MARSSESTMDYSSEMYGSLLVYRNDGEKGPIYDLSEGTTKIGASIDADIRLKLQDNRLEEVHCVVQVEENGTALLINKSSEAPVIVNGDALSQKKYRILKHEDHFVVLGKKFQYLNEHIAEQDYQKTVSVNRKSVAPILQTTSTKIPSQQRTVKQKTENRGRFSNFLTPNKYTNSRTCTGGSKTISKLVVSKSFSKLPTPRRRLSLNLVPQVLGAAKRTSNPKKACDCCVELIDSNSPKKSILKKPTPLKSRKSLLLNESTKSNSLVEGKYRSLPIADNMQDSSVSSSVDDSCDEGDLKLSLSEEEFSNQRCSRTLESKSTPPEEGSPEIISRSSRSSARGRPSSVILDNESDLEAKALEVSIRLSKKMYRSSISSVGDAIDNGNLTENISNFSRSPSVRKRTSSVNDKMMPVEADTPDRISRRKGTSSFADICSSKKMRSVTIDHLNDNKNENTPETSNRISRGVFRSSSSRRMSSVDDSRDEEDLKLLLSEEEFPSQIYSRISENKSTSSSEEEITKRISRSSKSSARGTSSVILDNETDLEASALEVSKRLSRRMYRSSISPVGDADDGGNLAKNIPNSTRSPSVRKTAYSVNDEMIPVKAETPNKTSTRKRSSSFADCSSSTNKRFSLVVIDHENENKTENTPETSKRILRGVFRSSSSRRTFSVHDAIDCSSPLDESTPQVSRRYSRNMNESSVHNHTEESDSALPLEKTNPGINISRSSTMRRTVSSTSVDNLVVVLQEKLPETISRSSRSSVKGKKSSVILDEQNDMITWDVESPENDKSLVKSTDISSTKRKTASLVSPAVEEKNVESDLCSVMIRSVSFTPVNNLVVILNGKSSETGNLPEEILSSTGKTPEMMSRSPVRGRKSLFVSDEEKTADINKRFSRSMNKSSTKTSPETSRRYSRKLNGSSVEARFADSASPSKEKTLETISRSTGVRRTVSSTSLDNLVVVLQEKSPENIQRYSRNSESDSTLASEEAPETISKASKWSMKGRKSVAICDEQNDIEIPLEAKLPEVSQIMSRRMERSSTLDKDTPEISRRSSRSAKRCSIHNQAEESNSLTLPFGEKTPETICRSSVGDIDEVNVKIRNSDTSERISSNNLRPEISLKNRKSLQSRSRSIKESSLIAFSDNSFNEEDTEGSPFRLSPSSLTSEFDLQNDEQTTSQISFRRSSIRASLRKNISPSGHSDDIVGQSPFETATSKLSLIRGSTERNSSVTELCDNDMKLNEISSNRRSSSSIRSQGDLQNEEQTAVRRFSVRTPSRRNVPSEDNIGQSLDVNRKSSLSRHSLKINSSATELSDNDQLMENIFDQEETKTSSNRRSAVRSKDDLQNEDQLMLRRSSVRTPSIRNLSSEDNVSQSPMDISRKSTLTRGFLKINSSLSDNDVEDSFDKEENERSETINRFSSSVEYQSDLHIERQSTHRKSSIRTASERNVSSEDSVGSSLTAANRKSSLSRGSLKKNSSSVELSDDDRENSFDQSEIESDLQNEDQIMLRRSSVRTYSKRNISSEHNVGQSPMDVNRKSSLRGSLSKNSSVIELSYNDMEDSFDQEDTESDLQNEDQKILRSSVRTYSRRNVNVDNVGQSPLDVSRKSLLCTGSLKMNSAIEISDNDMESSFDQRETSNKGSSPSLRSDNDLQKEDKTTLRRSSLRTPSKINVPSSRHSEDIAGQSSLEAAANRKSSLVRRSLKINSSAIEISDNDMENSFDQGETSNRLCSSSSLGSENDLQNLDQITLRRSSVKTYSRRNTSAEHNVGQSPMDVNKKSSLSRSSLKINSSATDMEYSFDQEETESNLQNEDQIMLKRSSIRTYSRRNVSSEDNICQSPLDVSRKSSLSRCSVKVNSPTIDLSDNAMENSFDQGETSNRRSSSSFRFDNDLQDEDQTSFRRSSARTLLKINVPSSGHSEDIAGQSSLDAASRKSSLSRGSSKINSSANELADDDLENSFDQEKTDRSSNRRSASFVMTESDLQSEDQIMLRRSSVRIPARKNVSSEDNIDHEAANEESSPRSAVKMNSSAIELFDNDTENSSDQELTERPSNRRSSSSVRSQCDPQIKDQIMLRISSVRTPSKRNVSSEDDIDPEAANKESLPRSSAKINSSAIELFDNDMENSSDQELTERPSNRRSSSSVRSQCDPQIEDQIMLRSSSVRTPSKRNVSSEDDINPEAANKESSPRMLRRSSVRKHSKINVSTDDTMGQSSPETANEKPSLSRRSANRNSSLVEPLVFESPAEDFDSDSKQNKKEKEDLATPKSSAKIRRPDDALYQPETENVSPVTPENKFKGLAEGGFKTPLNTPGLFDEIRKSMLKSRTRLHKSTGNVTEDLAGRSHQGDHGVKRQRVSVGSTRRSCKKMRLVINADDTFEESELLDSFQSDHIDEPTTAVVNSIFDSDGNMSGVKKMFATPKVAKSPKNDLTDIPNLRKIMFPKTQNSPNNDLTDVVGVKRLMKTPKKQQQRESFFVEGVAELLATPKKEVESAGSDIENNEEMFDRLFVRRRPRQYRGKTMSPKERGADASASGGGDRRKTTGEAPATPSPRVRHWVEEQRQRMKGMKEETSGDEKSTVSNDDMNLEPVVSMSPQEVVAEQIELTEISEDKAKNAGMKPFNKRGRKAKTVDEKKHVEREKPVRTNNRRGKNARTVEVKDEEKHVDEQKPIKTINRQGKNAKTVEVTDGTDVEVEELKPVNKNGRNVKTVELEDDNDAEKEIPVKTINSREERTPKPIDRRGRNAKTVKVIDGTGVEEEKMKPVTRGRNARTVLTDVEDETPKTVNRRGRNVKNETNIEEKPKRENKRGRKAKTMDEEIDLEEEKPVKTVNRRGKNAKPGQVENNHVNDAEEAEEKGESKKPAICRGRNVKAVDPSDQEANESVDKEESIKPANRRGRNFRLNVDEEIEKQDKEGPVEKTTKGKVKVTRNNGDKENNEDLESVDGRGAVEDAEEAEEKGESKKPALRIGRNAKAVDPSDQKENENVVKEESVKPANRRGRNFKLNVDEEIEKQDEEGPVEKTRKGKAKVTRNKDAKESDEDLKSVDGRGAVEDAEEAEEKGETKKRAVRRGRNAKAVDPSDQKANESIDKEESVKPANRRGRNLRSNVDEKIEKQDKEKRGPVEKTTKGKAKVTRNKGAKENDEDLKSLDGRAAVKDAEEAEEIDESKKPALRRGRNAKAVSRNDQTANESIDKENRNVDEEIEKEDQEEAVEKTTKGKGKVSRNKGSEKNDEVENVNGREAASASKRVLRGRRKASIDEEVVVPAKRGRKEKVEIVSLEQQVQTKAEKKLRSKVKSKMEAETLEKKRPRKNHKNEKKEEEEEVEAPVEKTRSKGNVAEKVTAQNVGDDSLTPRQTRAQRGNHKESDYESEGSRRRNNRARF